MAKANRTVVELPALQGKLLKGDILPPLAARALAKRETDNRFKFTKTVIDRLAAPDPSGKQKLFWDEELTGFGLLVSATTSAKSYIVQRKLQDGQTRRVTVAPTNVMELGAARDRAKEILAQFYKGVDPKAARREAVRSAGRQITLRAALETYLSKKKKKGGGELREKTKADYRASVERHLETWLDRPLRNITPEMILERHAEIQSEIDLGPKKNAQRSVQFTGHSSANGAMVALRAIWNFNARPGRVADLPPNPVGAMDNAWFSNKRRTRHVEDKDLPAFYRAVDELPSRLGRDYLKLLLFTGFRRREAAQLEWGHLDFDARVIHIPEAITKTGRPLDLPMSDFIYDLLAARRKLGRESKYVFAADGRHGYIQEPRFFLDQVAKSTGVRVSPHDLRRGFVTIAEASDISASSLKALVNHSQGSDVTSGYVQLTVERLREPTQRVANRIKELCAFADAKKKKPKAQPKKQKTR